MKNALDILRKIDHIESFDKSLARTNQNPLTAIGIDILQMNVGNRCNLSCKHCHVQAGPNGQRNMSKKVFDQCLNILKKSQISTVDITGGSPEMNPHFPAFLEAVSKLNRRVLVRSNVCILLEEEYSKYIDLYTRLGVELVTSLPDLHSEKSDRQRGAKTFDSIIEGIRRLNAKGYGQKGSGLILDLVHNPVGAYLPGPQASLEEEYRRQLFEQYGIHFNQLFSLTNCPIGRYLDYLVMSENLEDYMTDLYTAYNEAAVDRVMCRTTLSIAWDGSLYDCDFNQMLGLKVNHGAPDHIDEFDLKTLSNRQIMTQNHCYCCTAGAGSSCQGATTE